MKPASLALLFLLGACTSHGPESPDQASQGIPPTIRVATTETKQTVYIALSTGTLSDQQERSFVAFLVAVAAGNPDAVHLQVKTSLPPQALIRTALAAGVQPTKITVEPVSGPDARAGSVPVEVVASVSHVVPPDCPRQSVVNIDGYDNPVSSNFGCSVISNLEAQVADPRDLVQGESGGTTDAELTNAAIDRLHQDKVKPIQQESTGGGK